MSQLKPGDIVRVQPEFSNLPDEHLPMVIISGPVPIADINPAHEFGWLAVEALTGNREIWVYPAEILELF
jgi:hypothetical protein